MCVSMLVNIEGKMEEISLNYRQRDLCESRLFNQNIAY